MRLLLDVGNSRSKWRLLEHERVVAAGVLDDDLLESATFAILPVPRAVHGCCVASPDRQRQLADQCRRRWNQPIEWLHVSAECAGVRNAYLSPGLGVDRWASAIAAHARLAGGHWAAALAVNAGTALTVDLIRADGEFAGGSISPGLGLMRDALARGTARLPLASGEAEPVPVTTDSAIATGTLDAACGAIEYMARRCPTPLLILLSGGDAQLLARHLPLAAETVDNLVLDGLQVITR